MRIIKTFIIMFVLLIAAACTATYGGTSTNYRISTEVLDAGGARGQSSSYHLLGKTRALALATPSSTNFIIGEGFLRSAYFGLIIPILAPAVTSITPHKGYNNAIINITNLGGINFQTGAQVKLSKSGELDIAGTGVVVESTTKITCSFDLTNKAIGLWDVVVTNPDLQTGTLAHGFAIEAPGLKVTVPIISEKNPFNPLAGPTKLTYSLSKDANISIYIFNIRGERVWEYSAAAGSNGGRVGANDVSWDGITFNAYASNGVYFVRLTARSGGEIRTLSTTKILVRKE